MSDGYAAMEQELSPTPISRLNILEAYLSSIVPHLEDAQDALNNIQIDSVPEQYRQTLQTVQSSLPLSSPPSTNLNIFTDS